jgi:hypothetical protein
MGKMPHYMGWWASRCCKSIESSGLSLSLSLDQKTTGRGRKDQIERWLTGPLLPLAVGTLRVSLYH